ncbi:hypothetical protein LPTSP3_g10850 [Leptospira kobayashii]|uniref:Prenyltransferase n=1 Tax=Leptospira kobayashii TaxID=1917830 RepID=A0ABN6KB42_9LEPT|nr:hypothetical protein [Leptospira kobayashii]BDA78155.1 hypothetical protein LPTSP3_g10850 [Leptospira kobayashii]
MVKKLLFPFFYLSADVLLSVFGNVALLSFSLSVKPKVPILVCLGLAVFSIYILDRSFDSIREKGGVKTERGIFYQNKIGLTVFFGLLSLVICLTLSFLFLPFSFFLAGIILGFLVFLYFISTQFFRISFLPKEVVLSLLYTLGISFPVLLERFPVYEEYPIFFTLFLSVLCNVLLTYRNDSDWDKQFHFKTITLYLGKEYTTMLFYTLSGIGIGLCIYFGLQEPNHHLPALGLSFTFCYLIFLEPWGRKNSPVWFKTFCELAYTPFLFLWMI